MYNITVFGKVVYSTNYFPDYNSMLWDLKHSSWGNSVDAFLSM